MGKERREGMKGGCIMYEMRGDFIGIDRDKDCEGQVLVILNFKGVIVQLY